MTTKYILAGGNDRGVGGYGEELDDELHKSLSDIKMLSCFFSIPREEWQQKAEEWEKWFTQNLSKIVDYNYIQGDDFEKKIKASNVIYFHGGKTSLLLEKVKTIPGFKKMIEGKVVVGSSAGANMLSKKYWSPTYRYAGEGLGLVVENVMVHYGAKNIEGDTRNNKDWQKDEEMFRSFINNESILYIPEGELSVFPKNREKL